MNLSLETKSLILGTVSGLAAISIAFAAGEILRPKEAPATNTTAGLVIPPASTQQRQGYDLFMLNCAHCHGDDARGTEEAPNLTTLKKSDARVASLIANGIKGEMPRFGSKLREEDVRELIRFLHSLKPGQT